MVLYTDALWLVTAAGFFLAAALSLRNHLLTKKLSNLWLWLSIALGFICASFVTTFLASRNPLWQDASTNLLLIGATMFAIALFDFEKQVNVCVNCKGSLSGLPARKGGKSNLETRKNKSL